MSRNAAKLSIFAAVLLAGSQLANTPARTADAMPWANPALSPDQRASLLEAQMTDAERLQLIHGIMGMPIFGTVPPADAIGSAGHFPAIPRLGIPAIEESDASIGITDPTNVRPGDVATAFPSSAALAAGFDPAMAYAQGQVIGAEARAKGLNVVLDGGMNLTRDLLNGRNFEYLGEDPLLAGTLAGNATKGIQSNHVISTMKHFAVNAQETARHTVNEIADPAALRESDLLAFEIANEIGQPGSVMCSYNRVNGPWACGDDWLLNQVLKQDWGYPGWVMSDWGAVHSADYANNGLDQESGQQLDSQTYFDAPLRAELASGKISHARLSNMVQRILRSIFAVGLYDHPVPSKRQAIADGKGFGTGAIDYEAHKKIAGRAADGGIVLLKNEGLLPLTAGKTIAVIGGHAEAGVLAGAGSSYVTPYGGAVTIVAIGGTGEMASFNQMAYEPSSPYVAIDQRAGKTKVVFDDGRYPSSAAKTAAGADIAVVFATQFAGEGQDAPDLSLPDGQDAMIEAVAATNPHTIVVLETGGAVKMPWLSKVAGVLEAWYPGEDGGQAIARVLYGEVNPSGHLPMSFPRDESAFPAWQTGKDQFGPTVTLVEGSDVGYRWYNRQTTKPLFPFGYGLSYSNFGYSNLQVTGGNGLSVSFDVTNQGKLAGADVPQLYLTGKYLRLLGWQKLTLAPGATRHVTLSVDPRLLADFDSKHNTWTRAAGKVEVAVGHSSADFALRGDAGLTAISVKP